MTALYPQHRLRSCATALCAVLLTACSPAYLWQAASGQMKLVSGRVPVAELLDDPALEPALRERLLLSQEALGFAHDTLLLPDNGSYRTYYDAGSPYIVWNVFAAPEFALEPQTWCFPVTGCISYRGYFAEDDARAYAARLQEKGLDVFVAGIGAYSTLGRFEDPILSTMVERSDRAFVGLLFHELAHQRLYIKDDSAFNEGFATAVEEIGLQRWEAERGRLADAPGADAWELQRRQALALIEAARDQLRDVYSSDRVPEAKRAAKVDVIAELQADYAVLATEWEAGGWNARPYGWLITSGINNASLGAISTYADYVPAFLEIYRLCEQSLDCFYTRAEALGRQEADARAAMLDELAARAPQVD